MKKTKDSSKTATNDATAVKPNSSKVTDWSSIPWNDLGQTSDSRWVWSCDVT